MKQKRLLAITAVFFLIILINSSNVHGFTNLDLIGEYSLVGFTIQYPGYPLITQNDASSFFGRSSITTKGFVVEMKGYFPEYDTYPQVYNCAFYTVSGDKIYASIIGGDSAYIDIQLSGDSLITSGSDYDDGDYFEYTYTWKKNEDYYTQEQLNQVLISFLVNYRC